MAKNGILAKSHDVEETSSSSSLGDRFRFIGVRLEADGVVATTGRVVSTIAGLARHLEPLPPARFAFEVRCNRSDTRLGGSNMNSIVPLH